MYYYIVNPAAGNGAIAGIQERLKTSLHRLNIDGEFAKTIGEGDGAKIAKTAVNKHFKTIVAVGGDDTVNEVITAVHESGKKNIAIGIVPIGKTNTLATHLGIKDWQHATTVLSARRLQPYSLMSLNDHVFIYSVEIIPAKSSEEAEAPNESFEYLVDIDGKYRVNGEATKLIVHNQKFLSPSLDNQLVLQVHSYEPATKKKGFLHEILARFQTAGPGGPSFSQLHANKITIKNRSPAQVFMDGRPIDSGKLEIELSEYQLQLITNRIENPNL